MNFSFYRVLIIKSLVLFLLWLLLSERLNLYHMGLGLASAFAIAWFNTDRSSLHEKTLPLRIVWYFPWLIGRIMQSGFHLSKLILNPALPIDPKMIRYRTALREESGIVLLGNSITLTPGTITVELNTHELIVHSMDENSALDVTSNRIEKKIAGVFGEKGRE